MKIVAQIPARSGSQRVKNKNLRLLNGKPLISYVIEASKKVDFFHDIYVNTDCNNIGNYAKSLGVKYYKRPSILASNTATSDEYNYDFLKNHDLDLLVQINPVCPLITSDEIKEIINHFLDKDLDTLITVREERFQAFYKGEPINFSLDNALPRTQDLTPILICSWPICIWKKKSFTKKYEEKGHSVFSGKLGLYPVSFYSSLKISYEEDFTLAENLIKIRKNE